MGCMRAAPDTSGDYPHGGAARMQLIADDGRCPEQVAVVARHREEVQERRYQHDRVEEGAERRNAVWRWRLIAVASQASDQPRALRLREPAGVSGTVGENRQHADANEHRRKSLEEEDPLPPREPVPSVEPEQACTD